MMVENNTPRALSIRLVHMNIKKTNRRCDNVVSKKNFLIKKPKA